MTAAEEESDAALRLSCARELVTAALDDAQRCNTALLRLVAAAKANGATDAQIEDWTGLTQADLGRVYPLAAPVLTVVN